MRSRQHAGQQNSTGLTVAFPPKRSALATGRMMRRRDQSLSDADQTAAASDQELSDADRESSTAGWAASRAAQERSDSDQRASDLDQAAADREQHQTVHHTEAQLAASAQTRSDRADATADRAAASVERTTDDLVRAEHDRDREQSAIDRDLCSDARDTTSELRDQASAAAEQQLPVNDGTAIDLFESARLRMVDAATRTAAAQQRRAAAACRASELAEEATRAIEFSRALDAAAEAGSGDIDADSPRAPQIVKHLAGAADRGELTLHYQPLYSLAEGELTGFEALLRWTSPELGIVTPDEFIPVAEATGLIIPIGDWVIATALQTLATWRSERPGRHLTMAINIAPEQITVPSFVESLARLLDTCGVPPSALTLEVTERTLVADTPALHCVMAHLRSIGVQMSVDDFGTGFSSLGRLATLPLDEIKIDRIFVASLADDRRQRALVAGILAMSAALDLRVVAEGIETEEQRRTLLSLGCELGQGYLLGRPAARARATEIVSTSAPAHITAERITWHGRSPYPPTSKAPSELRA